MEISGPAVLQFKTGRRHVPLCMASCVRLGSVFQISSVTLDTATISIMPALAPRIVLTFSQTARSSSSAHKRIGVSAKGLASRDNHAEVLRGEGDAQLRLTSHPADCVS